MNNTSQNSGDQAAAFQKIWAESVGKLLQTALTFGTDSPPSEVLREVRNGIFQALAKSWEEFMRSPQFLEGMRQWMDNAITFRKMSNDFMANVRNEVQATSRDDIDTVMLAVRHMEKRVLDRVEELSAQVSELETRAGKSDSRGTRATAPKAGPHGRKSKKSSRAAGKAPRL